MAKAAVGRSHERPGLLPDSYLRLRSDHPGLYRARVGSVRRPAFWSIGVGDRPQGERLLACGLQALKCDPRLKRLPSRKLPTQLKRPSKFAVRADPVYAPSVDLFDGATELVGHALVRHALVGHAPVSEFLKWSVVALSERLATGSPARMVKVAADPDTQKPRCMMHRGLSFALG